MITIHLRTLAAALLAATALPSAAQNRPAVDVERLWLDPAAKGSLVLGRLPLVIAQNGED